MCLVVAERVVPDSKSTSQGITYGTGNQGVPQGSANAERYGPGGGIGNGVSFSLDGRTSQSLPKPRYPGNEEGVVVVQVTVNKSGQVTKAEAGVRGSNTADPELISAAKKAALQAKFNVDNNAPAYQPAQLLTALCWIKSSIFHFTIFCVFLFDLILQ